MVETRHPAWPVRDGEEVDTTVYARWDYEPEDRTWHLLEMWAEPHPLTEEERETQFQTAYDRVLQGDYYNPLPEDDRTDEF